MAHILTVIAVDGTVTETTHAKSPGIEALQAACGGFVQIVPHFTKYDGKRCTAYCDEEGKIYGKAVNQAATWAWYEAAGALSAGDLLVGPIAIVRKA